MKESTIRENRRIFNKHLLPSIGKINIELLTRRQIQALVEKIEKEFKPGTGRCSKKVLHSIYSFALWQDLVKVNPCVEVSYTSSKERTVVYTDDQVRMIWDAFTPPVSVDDATVSASVAYAILLCIVLGQRRSEVASMRVSQIDLEMNAWLIPKDVAKNRQEHAVPLTPLALQLIRQALVVRSSQDTDYIFPGHRDRSISIKGAALTRAFTRVRKALNWPDLWLHDARRTAATNMAKLGVLKYHISAVLNHTSDNGGAAEATSFYNRWHYFPEKAAALELWANRLADITENKLARPRLVA